MLNWFTIARLRFQLQALDPILLPPYKGSAFRGGFGHAFRKTVCALRLRQCDGCLLREKCIYSYVFETPPPPGAEIMRKYPRAPHPFVLEPPEEDNGVYEPGSEISFGLTLVGKAAEYLPYFIYSFDQLGKMGIGKGKGKFDLRSVRTSGYPEMASAREVFGFQGEIVYDSATKQYVKPKREITWEELCRVPPPASRRLSLRFRTPARIRYAGRYTMELDFHILVRNLLRRISTMAYFHCGGELRLDFRGLIEKARAVEVEESSLAWYDWERYSTRQATRMKMGGVVGSVTYAGDIEPFWPFVVLGQVIHVGKGTAFGLGRYEIDGL